MTQPTTSLELSKRIVAAYNKAGKDVLETHCWWCLLDDEWVELCVHEMILYAYNGTTPAFQLHDLVTALGLDKPMSSGQRGSWHERNMLFIAVYASMRARGLTPETLGLILAERLEGEAE